MLLSGLALDCVWCQQLLVLPYLSLALKERSCGPCLPGTVCPARRCSSSELSINECGNRAKATGCYQQVVLPLTSDDKASTLCLLADLRACVVFVSSTDVFQICSILTWQMTQGERHADEGNLHFFGSRVLQYWCIYKYSVWNGTLKTNYCKKNAKS